MSQFVRSKWLNTMKSMAIMVGGASLLAACGGGSDQPANGGESTAATASARPPEFQQCAICHADKPGAPRRTGPNLVGIAGTKAGTVPADFAFSAAMKASNIVWTREKLDAFIEHPSAVVPGTRMMFMGVRDPAQRKTIVDYLETLK